MTDDELLKRPVIVLGAPRSGTSLLCNVLKDHPDLHLVEEPRILWKHGNDSRSDALRPRHATPEVIAAIRRGLAQRVREAGKTRLLEKTPSNSLRVGFVNAVLPDAVFLHVMRSGAESVLSIRQFWQRHSTGVPTNMLRKRLKEMSLRQAPYYAREFFRRVVGKVLPGAAGPAVWGPRPPGIEQMARDLDPLEVAAWQWRMCVETACREGRALPPDRYTECRLEGIGDELLERLQRFAGLEPAAEVLAEFHSRFEADQPTRRTRAADDAEVAYVRSLIEPTEGWLAATPMVERH